MHKNNTTITISAVPIK